MCQQCCSFKLRCHFTSVKAILFQPKLKRETKPGAPMGLLPLSPPLLPRVPRQLLQLLRQRSRVQQRQFQEGLGDSYPGINLIKHFWTNLCSGKIRQRVCLLGTFSNLNSKVCIPCATTLSIVTLCKTTLSITFKKMRHSE